MKAHPSLVDASKFIINFCANRVVPPFRLSSSIQRHLHADEKLKSPETNSLERQRGVKNTISFYTLMDDAETVTTPPFSKKRLGPTTKYRYSSRRTQTQKRSNPAFALRMHTKARTCMKRPEKSCDEFLDVEPRGRLWWRVWFACIRKWNLGNPHVCRGVESPWRRLGRSRYTDSHVAFSAMASRTMAPLTSTDGALDGS
ncbi:hypothetical protein B0T10DRAFT_324025 [Thelonectria olida]|uniref:Uncharacterized protein n=1 Tax=Thelonectria olida TaxID=1576542 RepID=A0A9P9AQM4_9HYPO|nr:hypothetical protein B0T10DRAFT_324025 [Thelonectria olida]